MRRSANSSGAHDRFEARGIRAEIVEASRENDVVGQIICVGIAQSNFDVPLPTARRDRVLIQVTAVFFQLFVFYLNFP